MTLKYRFPYLICISFLICTCNSKEREIERSLPLKNLAKFYDKDEIDSILSIHQNLEADLNLYLQNTQDSVKAEVYNIFAYAFKKSQNYQQSIAHYEKSLSFALQAFRDNHSKVSRVYNNLGNIYKNLGEYDLAIEYYKKDLSIDQTKHSYAITYNNIAGLYRRMEVYDSAIHYYEKSIELQPMKTKHMPLDNLGILYIRKGEYDKARDYLKEALAIREELISKDDPYSFLRSVSLNNLGFSYFEEAGYEKAVGHFEQALEISHDHLETRFYSLGYKAEVLKKLGKLSQALTIVKEADSLLFKTQGRIQSQADKLFFVSRTKSFGDLGFELAYQIGDLESAFRFSERSKGTVLQELKAKSGADLNKYQTVSIPEIQKRLKGNKALIEYKFLRDSLYAFVITRETAQLSYVSSGNIDFLALSFKDAITTLDKEYVKIAHALYKSILQPIISQVSGASELLIIPDEHLDIPFEALLSRPVQDKEHWKQGYFAKLNYLVKDYVISYHISASLAMSGEEASSYKNEFISFAPSFKKSTLKPLAHSQEASNFAARLFKPSKAFKNDASKAQFVALINEGLDSRILHFDTHGIAHKTWADSTALAFEDSLLYLPEISQLPKFSNCELLVLAACSSGDGVYSKGEGVLSLARAFIGLGARNAIHSLWLALDEPAANLLKAFYEQVLEGAEYDKALRQAKLQLIQELEHPVFWSNFVLISVL